MDKRVAALLGATAAFTAVGGVQASTTTATNELPAAASYRDLLKPVPNAMAVLQLDNERLAREPKTAPSKVAQWHHHHHHHHHHGGYFGGGVGFGVGPVLVVPGPGYGPPPPPPCPPVWNGYRWVYPRYC